MSFNISDGDIEWLKKNYSGLKFYSGNPPVIRGTLEFDALYKDKESEQDHPRIKDSYEIEIILSSKSPSILPRIRETGGRIKKAKEKFGKESLADIHVNPDETVCLCAYPEEKIKLPNGFDLKDFFGGLLIPYFYAQSFFEKTGKWIWGERSHGTLGLLESYFDNRGDGKNIGLTKGYIEDLKQLQDSELFYQTLFKRKKIKGHVPCYCGSKLKFRNCHKNAFYGLWNLKEDIKSNKIIV